ncbi:MAG: DUF2283 domain-containing protein [Acidilobus sp.]
MGEEGSARRLVIEDPGSIWVEYDKQSDTLYIGFGKEEAEESLLLENGIIVNYKGDKLLSLIIQGLSERLGL